MKSPSKNLLLQLVNGTREPLLVVDTARDDWRVNFFNPALQRLLGIAAGEISHQAAEPILIKLAGSTAVDAVRPCGAEQPQTQVDSVLLRPDKPDRAIDGQVLMLGSGGLRAIYLSVAAPVEHASTSTSSVQLRALASDPVTGFLEREHWLDVLGRDAAIAAREQAWLAVIALRVDAMSAYIDTFGQHAGDSALKRIGHSIRRRLKRAGDMGGRIGPDMMALLVHGSSAPMALEFAESIAEDIRALAIHHPRSPRSRHISLSAGVCAEVPTGDVNAALLLQRAVAQIDAPPENVHIADSLPVR